MNRENEQLLPKSSLPPEVISELVERATSARSIREVLAALEPAIRTFDLTNIRYYRYSPTRKTLVSQEAILEYPPTENLELREFEEALRQGAIFANETESDEDCESFWCFRLQRPVVFMLAPELDRPMRPNIREKGPVLIDVKMHSCQNTYFARHKARFTKWVDIPLYIGETPVGKFSLDFTENGKERCDKSPGESERHLNFLFNLCQYVSPHLEYWISHELSSQLNNAASKFRNITSTKELYSFCTQVLPQEHYFNCEHIDLLLLEKSDSGVSRLVLKASSNRFREADLCHEYYEIPETDSLRTRDDDVEVSLTIWTAISKRGARFTDLFDNDLRRREQNFYQTRIGGSVVRPAWENRVPLVGVVRSTMFLPIVSSGKTESHTNIQGENDVEILGVLRFANKKGTMRSAFTAYDLRIGEILSRYYIGPAISNCKNSAYRESVHRFIAEATTVSGLGAPIESQPLKQLAKKVLSDGTKSFRQLTICQTDNTASPTKYRSTIVYSNSDNPQGKEVLQNWLEIPKGSLIDNSLNMVDPLTFFVDELSDSHLPRSLIVHDAVVVVAVRIIDNGNMLGVLLLSSTHYDLVYETDLAGVVQSLANVFGSSFRQIERASVGLRLSLLRHDFRDLLDALDVAIAHKKFEEQTFICDLMRSLIETICIKSYRDLLATGPTALNIDETVVKVVRVLELMYKVNIENQSPPCVVMGEFPTPVLTAFLYGALHNALDYGDRKTVRVITSITQDSNLSLEIVVENECKEEQHFNRLKESSEKFLSSTESNTELQNPSGIGVPRLAAMIRETGGSFSPEYSNFVVRVKVTFPINSFRELKDD